MNVKSLRKQLMAAIAMVMVAAIALGSSTYAWFANNTSVTAQGMTVNAKSDSILLQIAGSDDSYGTYGTIGTSTLSNATMKPTTSADGTNFAVLSSTVKVENAASASATWTGTNGAFQATDLVTKSSSDGDYATFVATTQYKLKCDTGNVANVYVKSVSANVTPTSGKTISKAVRISVTCGSKTLLFNPLSGEYVTQTIDSTTYTGAGKLTDATWSLANPTITTPGSTAIIADTIGTTPSDVTVRVWFEGQDTTCFTNNVDTAGVSIVIEFATDSTTVTA